MDARPPVLLTWMDGRTIFPYNIVSGPGGNVWFTATYADRLGEITIAR